MRRWRCCYLLLPMLMLAGCGGTGGSGTIPRITSAAVEPEVLTFRGGAVRFEVAAQADGGVVEVTARIGSGGPAETVRLTRDAQSWTGEWVAPANPTGAVRDYVVTFVAANSRELASAPVQRGFSVGVADAEAIPLPPPPPPPAPPAEG